MKIFKYWSDVTATWMEKIPNYSKIFKYMTVNEGFYRRNIFVGCPIRKFNLANFVILFSGGLLLMGEVRKSADVKISRSELGGLPR